MRKIVGVLLLLLAQPLDAQERIRVAVAVTDTTRVLESQIRAALRALGDIEIVESYTNEQYGIEGVFLCTEPGCSSYAGSVRLYSTLRPTELFSALFDAGILGRDTASNNRLFVSPKLDKATSNLGLYQQTRNVWAVYWGRNRYETAIRELIAKIDSGCFEKNRRWDALDRLPKAARDTAMMTVARLKWEYC